MRATFMIIRIRPWLILASCVLAAALVGYIFETARAPGQQQTRSPVTGLRVVIDPGHGGVDGGCHRQDFFEKDLNLAVSRELLNRLEAQGAVVRPTRTTDEALVPWGSPGGSRHRRDLMARIQIAREFDAQVYISLHANAGPAHLGGALTFYRKGDAESMRLAALIQEQLTRLVPGNQNGILPAKFLVLSSQSVPAVLIEMGFLTHPRDYAFLTSSDAPALVATGIAQGVAAFVQGVVPATPTFSPYPTPTGEDPDTSPGPYPGCDVNINEVAMQRW